MLSLDLTDRVEIPKGVACADSSVPKKRDWSGSLTQGFREVPSPQLTCKSIGHSGQLCGIPVPQSIDVVRESYGESRTIEQGPPHERRVTARAAHVRNEREQRVEAFVYRTLQQPSILELQ